MCFYHLLCEIVCPEYPYLQNYHYFHSLGVETKIGRQFAIFTQDEKSKHPIFSNGAH